MYLPTSLPFPPSAIHHLLLAKEFLYTTIRVRIPSGQLMFQSLHRRDDDWVSEVLRDVLNLRDEQGGGEG